MIKEGFKLPEDGLYSGFDAATQDLRQVHLELRGSGRRTLTAEQPAGPAALPPTSLSIPRSKIRAASISC